MCLIKIDPTPVLIKIWDATAGELKHLRRPKPRIEELKNAKAGLEAKAVDINRTINEAEREEHIPTAGIQHWIRDVEEWKARATAIEQDYESWRCLCGWSWNCFWVNRRVARRMDKIHELMTRPAPPFTTQQPPPTVEVIPTSNSTLAMEANMSEILGYIASPNASEVIGVYGMGGVGKTTLLKSINNHKDVIKFDYVIWAVASKECKIERLQMDIARRLGLPLKQDDNNEYRATKLFNFLKNKDCLLLLDDVWEQLDLEMLGMVNASSGQGEQKHKVVVFTTRRQQVCGGMNASKEMQIKCLEPNEAWELFRRNAGEDAIGSDAGIDHIARQIAKECDGLPLALITVGVAMSRKKTWEAWRDALTQMQQSQMPKVTGKKEEDLMFSAFKLSYNSLEDDVMRGCLLSCAMWPEDHSIENEELIECWMGLGLIDEEGVIHNVYNRGHSHIETLKAACLLEPGNEEGEVKMHDVIRDMALWMTSDCDKEKFKWIVRARVAASQALEEKGWHEVERVSLMYNDIASLPNELPTCSRLSVLMLQCNWQLKEFCGTLIQAMPYLTYLDLEKTGITEIPKEIDKLSQLRYLNLSYTFIRELPAELGCLINLNYLLLRETLFLTVVAKGAISSLSSLRFLDLTRSLKLQKWTDSEYKDLFDELEGLKGCQKYSIRIDIMTAVALQRLCSLSHVSIWRLNVCFFF